MNSQATEAHNGEVSASRTPDPCEVRDRTTAETAEPPLAKVASIRKIKANRANARKSTGPRTDEGKRASRMNALIHGLWAQAIVITAGDYQEDAQAFAQLLEGLREEFTPVGVAEDLEVQTLAHGYWRKMRAARYEHGAIRKRTGDMRAREEYSRQESFDELFQFGGYFERTSRGIRCLIGVLNRAKRELRDGTLAGEGFTWLKKKYADQYPAPDETQVAQEGNRRVPTAAYRDQIVATIDRQLGWFVPLHAKVAEREALNLESEIHAAALPEPEVVDKLVRYESSNDRALDRAFHRLEAMQARRRKQGDTPAEN